MTNEYKRDLHADLALCEAATPGHWRYVTVSDDDNGSVVDRDGVCVMDFGISPDIYDQTSSAGSPPDDLNMAFILESREGWPGAIRRAIEAERWLKALVSALDDGRIARTQMSSGMDYMVFGARLHVRNLESPPATTETGEEGLSLQELLGEIYAKAQNDVARWDGGVCVGTPVFQDRSYARRLVRELRPLLFPEVSVDATR
ncbi:hypothetical protein MKY59_21710 [Paenibacillus sp. FSL W8-0426]|uniref:hypothetical protein n=1 Tax=Paenibacillus sp. FSL W8-0426 TaxID=2921714 RepID=UPI0030D9DB4F